MLKPFKKFKAIYEESHVRQIELSLMEIDQLKNTIYKIYTEKDKIDDEMKIKGDHRIPMCQYFYQYFIKKSKTNNKAISIIYNFMNSLKISTHDPEIALFGLIMQNKIEEEFVEVFYQIKEMINDLKIKEIEKSEENLYNEEKNEINSILAYKIVDEMYTEINPNKDQIIQKIGNLVEQVQRKKKLSRLMKIKKNGKIKLNSKSKYEPKTSKNGNFISFYEFERYILNQEVKTHLLYLNALGKEFKNLDPNNYGCIPSNKLQILINNLFWNQKIKPYANNFLKKRKNYNTDTLTFSDVVSFFSKDQVNNDFKNVLEIINEKYYIKNS